MTRLSFSIVTCTWNSEPYIARCIESVAQQTHERLEHIFVDGGSTDGTWQRICAVGGNSQRVTDVRGGIAAAMNTGASMASGDVIAHLHGDDYYLDAQVIESVSEAMQSTGAGWLFGRILSDIDGRQLAQTWTMPHYSAERLLARNFVPHPATFVRRELFKQAGGFDTALRYAMDYDLWLRLARVSEPVSLDIPLAAFRRHAGSASTANARETFEEDHRVRMRYAAGSLSRRRHDFVHAVRRIREFGPLKWRSPLKAATK